MKLLRPSSENEMIALFLSSEIKSERYQPRIAEVLSKHQFPREIADKPNLSSDGENWHRRLVISEYRGYGENRELFENFPKIVDWQWASLERRELEKVLYIDYDYWVKLSGGSRLPKDGVKKIKNGVEIFGEGNERFFQAAKALKGGEKFPPLILVSTGFGEKLVVLEGHLRLTVYFLEPKFIPEKISVLIGISPEFSKWDLY